jgi:HD-GYP domain-containing protein (c-di-GMP phosphodiesterase class II)
VEPSTEPSAACVRTAEIIAALSLAADLSTGMELEHGLRSALVAMRLADRLGLDAATQSQSFYLTLLFYVGCTADAELAATLFPEDGAMRTHMAPVMMGSRTEMLKGMVRALGSSRQSSVGQVLDGVRRLPKAAGGRQRHLESSCEVATMLAGRLGLPVAVNSLFEFLTERWDGKGEPGRVKGEELPLAVRLAHVARDAAFQSELAGTAHATEVVRARAGHAFDPEVAAALADDAGEVLAMPGGSAWDELLGCEPGPVLTLVGDDIDRALGAMGDFADISSRYLAGHSAGVAALASQAAQHYRLGAEATTCVRRAALIHDLGRVTVSVRVWHKAGPLSPDEWERVRLHPYHAERILSRSPYLATLGSLAGSHHERLDASGYHRGAAASNLVPAARLLAAADAYHAMTEPRPHRAALPGDAAAAALNTEAKVGRLDGDAVAAVLDAAGQRVERVGRPAGLTEREAEVIALLARGLQTKQVARALDISPKTADRHIQHVYAKIGVSTRAAATLFAMEHGLMR